MKNKKFISMLAFLFFTNIYSQKIKIGLFDTTNIEKYKYKNFIDVSESAGFEVDYKSFIKIIDNEKKLNLSQYDGIIFIVGIEFLKGIANNSKVSSKILEIIKIFGKQNKLIGLALPSIGGNKIINKANLFAPIFNAININVLSNNYLSAKIPNYISNSLFILLNNFLNIPMEARGFWYHTTLSSPRKGKFRYINPVKTKFFATLPINSITKDPTLPYGIYWSNPFNKKQIFITSSSLLSFAGISENFHVCPTNYKLRLQMLKNIQKMMQELNTILTIKKIDYQKIIKNNQMELPKSLKKIGKSIQNKGEHFFKKIAWMDINIFEKEDEESIKKQKKLIDSILFSNSNLTLWLTLNPHMYYSPIGKKKNNINMFLKSISKFTKALKIKSEKLNIKTPKILIGFETANNLYAPDLPKNCAFDIYGNKYYDIPNPIDFNFWKQEIIKPLKIFLSKWKNPKINNGIKLGGMVLDLEMYCRRTSSTFLSTIGFNSKNIKKYNNKDLNYIIENRELKKYYNFLERRADIIGKKIKRNFYKIFPKGIIACYAPNISTSWFYKNFYKGLSSSKKPIQLLTFNSEFNSHINWLEKNNIFAKHSSVLMLSKINNKKDFWWVDKKLKHHHGVWFNKFSRFSEDIHNEWMSIEQSKMNKKDQKAFFKMLSNK
ncbi:hypothetical protein GF385_04355 [Candidatus Dependentiae bacterium]|nr:hypothetical protein [Candidatus Dependentiae bacterium]